MLSAAPRTIRALIGEPGVGKTAIVEGLALRILTGDVPESPEGQKLLSLDMGAPVAGAGIPRRVRGAAEGRAAGSCRCRGFDHPVHRRDGIRWSAPARRRRDGCVNTPAGARAGARELHRIGAATLDEWPQHVEKDAALARRFQPVFVSSRKSSITVSMLRGLKDKYEAATWRSLHRLPRWWRRPRMSNRYITDRFLPDKADST